jgi:WD40 repeat protein
LLLSQGDDHAIRHLNLTGQCFLHYFKGHTEKVTTVAMSPKTDMFMSASQVGAWVGGWVGWAPALLRHVPSLTWRQDVPACLAASLQAVHS